MFLRLGSKLDISSYIITDDWDSDYRVVGIKLWKVYIWFEFHHRKFLFGWNHWIGESEFKSE